MGKSQRIRAGDVRCMLQLMNELHELPPGSRVPHMLERLCGLCDAQSASWVGVKDAVPGKTPRFAAATGRGWLDEQGQKAFAEYMQGDPTIDPYLMAMVNVPGRHITRGRNQLVADNEWYRSAYVQDYRRAANVDDNLGSYTRLDATGRACGTTLMKTWGARPFGRRERLLLHLFHTELGWMYRGLGQSGNERRQPHLSKRESEVLARLLIGESEKQIAHFLGISKATVHEYVGQVYRKHSVSGRAELMALFVTSNATALVRH